MEHQEQGDRYWPDDRREVAVGTGGAFIRNPILGRSDLPDRFELPYILDPAANLRRSGQARWTGASPLAPRSNWKR